MIEYIDDRLKAIASMVPIHSSVADIGTDHAYLAIYLISENIASRVVASDVNLGPYKVAKDMVAKYQLEDKISVRHGDGLTTLKPHEVDTICIAGMGGGLIKTLLISSFDVLSFAKSLILQPMNDSYQLRSWLYDNNFSITEEKLVKAKSRIYEIIKAEPISAAKPSDVLLEIGTIIAEEKNELFREYIKAKIIKLERALAGMEKSTQALNSPKYQAAKMRIKELERFLS